MKANYFRIGNYVNSRLDGLSIISSIEKYGNRVGITPLIFKNYVFTNSEFDPIPIRAEVLENLGFELNHVKSCYEVGVYSLLEFDVYNELTSDFYIIYNNKRITFKYVHELQNLYFSFAKEELTFKP